MVIGKSPQQGFQAPLQSHLVPLTGLLIEQLIAHGIWLAAHSIVSKPSVPLFTPFSCLNCTLLPWGVVILSCLSVTTSDAGSLLWLAQVGASGPPVYFHSTSHIPSHHLLLNIILSERSSWSSTALSVILLCVSIHYIWPRTTYYNHLGICLCTDLCLSPLLKWRL